MKLTDYATPFAHLFRDLTAAELAALEESAREIGFYHPVLTYDSEAHGPALIDGHNRVRVAARLGLSESLKRVHLGDLPDDAAEEIARRVNADRRHLTPAEQHLARADRVRRVLEKRTEGKSLRAIADEEGVSHTQIIRDLDEVETSGGTGVTPDYENPGVTPVPPEPERVTGRDGKTYPAARPEPEDEPEPVTDEHGEILDDRKPGELLADLTGRVPAPSGRLPSYFKPGNNTDPDHQYYAILTKIDALTAQITKSLNDSDEDDKLFTYLCHAGLVHARDLRVNGKHKGHRFIGFRGLRWVVKLAGLPGKVRSKVQIINGMAKAEGEDE